MTNLNRALHAALLAGLLTLSAPAAAQVVRADPQLEIASWQGREIVRGQVLVQFSPEALAPQQDAAAAALGCRRLATITDTLVQMALPDGADLDTLLARWQSVPGVEFAQPNAIHRPVGVPDDPKWYQQWHLPKVRADLAWDSYQGDPAAVVAVIDSGVDTQHADLDGQLAWAWDFYAGDSDPADQNGHGSHCCGLAAAETGNAVGVAGVAPHCRFAAYRCGDLTFPSSALVAAINDARSKGALVLSMSWGSSYNDPVIRYALQAARDAGCVLVAAAGNDNSSVSFYPAALDFVIAVGATTNADAKASFSNFGSWVDVAAPGQSIYSTWKAGGYQYASGTSMACPIVAGIADLLYARLGSVRSTAQAAAVRSAIESTGVPVGNWVQHGRVDLRAALDAITPPVAAPHIDTVVPGSVAAFGGSTVTVTGSGFTGATAVSVDGQAVAGVQVLNDATLQFTAPPAQLLGPAAVVVTGPGGSSHASSFLWVATQPPQLDVPSSVAQGTSCTWRFGGGVNASYSLLAALDGTTFLHLGQPVLLHFVILHSGALDAAGLGSLSGTLPPGSAGISFRSQLVTAGGGFATSAIATTTITP